MIVLCWTCSIPRVAPREGPISSKTRPHTHHLESIHPITEDPGYYLASEPPQTWRIPRRSLPPFGFGNFPSSGGTHRIIFVIFTLYRSTTLLRYACTESCIIQTGMQTSVHYGQTAYRTKQVCSLFAPHKHCMCALPTAYVGRFGERQPVDRSRSLCHVNEHKS
jgi:hypothetical protein